MQSNTSKEDKQVDDALDSLIKQIQQIRTSINALMVKLETEYTTLTWLNVLDNFALISSDINSLTRLIKSAKMPLLKNYAIVPLLLSPDVDQELQNLTEGRVPMFTHEVAPNYLRTKPFPEVEDKLSNLQTKAGNTSQDVMNKQITTLNKLLNNVHEAVKTRKESAENDFGQKSLMQPTSSPNDTAILVSAIMCGKGLKSHSQASSGMSSGVHQPLQDQRIMPPTPQAMVGAETNKASSTVRTTIKAAASSHPYNR